MRDLRGDRLAMIFQEPMTSLNPSYTIGDQIIEVLVRHRGLSEAQAREKAIALLKRAGIPSPVERIDDYPHKLSGGMRQRAMIAIALACDPELLIADEPTTALDVTIQAQILDLMRELKRTSDAAIILITHDLGVVAEVCDEVAVMYAGEIVERAPADALFEAPEHPYTVGLLASIPRLDERTDRLAAIDGVLPDMTAPPIGCRFADRCPVRAGGVPRRAAAGRRSRRALVALPARAAGAARAMTALVDVPFSPLPACGERSTRRSIAQAWRARGAFHALSPLRVPLTRLAPLATPSPQAGRGNMTALVEAEGLVKRFVARRSIFGRPTAHVHAVDGVSFTVEAGKTLALVGESGSGKSTVGRLVLRLIEPTAGRVRFAGEDVFALSEAGTRAYRRQAQLVFQDPYASLNPRMTVADIIGEPIALHNIVPPAQRRASASRRCWRWSGSSRALRRAIRTNFPAGSASAS